VERKMREREGIIGWEREEGGESDMGREREIDMEGVGVRILGGERERGRERGRGSGGEIV
jgi:hypothetical protein